MENDTGHKNMTGRSVLTMIRNHLKIFETAERAGSSKLCLYIEKTEATALVELFEVMNSQYQKLTVACDDVARQLERAENQNKNQQSTIRAQKYGLDRLNAVLAQRDQRLSEYLDQIKEFNDRIDRLEGSPVMVNLCDAMPQGEKAPSSDGAQYIHVGGVTFRVILEHAKI